LHVATCEAVRSAILPTAGFLVLCLLFSSWKHVWDGRTDGRTGKTRKAVIRPRNEQLCFCVTIWHLWMFEYRSSGLWLLPDNLHRLQQSSVSLSLCSCGAGHSTCRPETLCAPSHRHRHSASPLMPAAGFRATQRTKRTQARTQRTQRTQAAQQPKQ